MWRHLRQCGVKIVKNMPGSTRHDFRHREPVRHRCRGGNLGGLGRILGGISQSSRVEMALSGIHGRSISPNDAVLHVLNSLMMRFFRFRFIPKIRLEAPALI
jgi:hypothetical protein